MVLNEGDVIAGKYRVEKLLGEGGMGAVYVALNTVLQRQVALKVMTGSFAQVPAAVERFHREAVAASKVSHPSIVQVFDAGQHEGAPWIAMELLEGESLGDRLMRGPLSLDEVMIMARGALSALAEVHEQGIVHRDLKPDNIFLAKDRSGSFIPKVLDFGIAKDTSGDQLNKLTATGAVVGTAYYLSPEQAKGTPDIDARADVYAMGVVLFEALSGHMPYEAETITQLIAKMFTEPPRLLAEVAPDIPAPVADIVTVCLQQEREHRFHSARELLDALENAVGLAPGAVGLAHTAQGAHQPASRPGVVTGPVGPSSGVAGSAMGHQVGYAGSAPGFASAPGVSQPGHAQTPNPGYPMTGVGQPFSAPGSQPGVPSHPGMHQTAHLAPHQIQNALGAAPLAQAPSSRGGSGKAAIVVLVVLLFFIGAAGTGVVAWLAISTDAGGASASAEPPRPVASPPLPPSVAVPDVAPAAAADTPSVASAVAPAPVASPIAPVADALATEPTPAEASRSSRRRERQRRAASVEPPAVAPPLPAAAPGPTPPARQVEPMRPTRPRPRHGISQQQITTAINARRQYAQRRCFERRRRRVPGLSGIVTIGWTVRPDGRVSDPQVLHNSSDDEWFGRCIRNVVSQTRFPAATNGLSTPARFPFRF